MTGDLFQETTESLAEALGEDEPPNVAVVSEPYAGREGVVEEAAERIGGTAERFAFSSVADASERAGGFAESGGRDGDGTGTGVAVVEGCEYLYTRRIDGFEPLDRFVEAVASSEKTVVASWNSYAWSYAEQATEVGDVFHEVVSLPSVGVREIADHLSSECDVSGFEEDLERLEGEEYSGTVERLLAERLPVDVSRFASEESENAFERITALSGGNPGVARAVFESGEWSGEGGEPELGLSYEDAFALSVVLTKETVERGVLEDVVAPRSTERSIRKLSDSGVAEAGGGVVSLRPERLADTVGYLRRRRLVW